MKAFISEYYFLITNDLETVFLSVSFLVLGYILVLLHDKYLNPSFVKFAQRKSVPLNDRAGVLLRKPINFLIISVAIYFFVTIFPVMQQHDLALDLLMYNLLRIFVILSFSWALCVIIGSKEFVERFFLKNSFDEKMRGVIAGFLANFIVAIIVALSVVIVLDELGYDINGLLAGLGLGGLTFALAAKDMVSNIFAGIIIMIDSPFIVGDWIRTDNIDGVVEDISFRSTRIRTFQDTLITVPNSTLSMAQVNNMTKMNNRQVNIHFGITYSTPPETVSNITLQLKEYLLKNEDIVDKRITVYFTEFQENSLDINTIYYTTFTDLESYSRVRQDVNLEIMRIVQKNGASFAFPTRTVIVENPKII